MASPLPQKIAGRDGTLLEIEAGGSITANTPTSGGKTTVSVGVNISTATTTAVIAAQPGYKIKVVGIILFSAGTNTVTLKRGTTALCGQFDLVAQSGFTMNIGENTPILETAVNEAFNITTTAATQLSGVVVYFLEA